MILFGFKFVWLIRSWAFRSVWYSLYWYCVFKQVGWRRELSTALDKVAVTGSPRFEKVSTSHVERQNLTMRMHMRRFTRLTNGFSKKIENHANAVALHFMYYNFAKIHKTLRVTPAMEAGICDHVWSIEEIARLIPEPVAKKRGSYKTREATI